MSDGGYNVWDHQFHVQQNGHADRRVSFGEDISPTIPHDARDSAVAGLSTPMSSQRACENCSSLFFTVKPNFCGHCRSPVPTPLTHTLCMDTVASTSTITRSTVTSSVTTAGSDSDAFAEGNVYNTLAEAVEALRSYSTYHQRGTSYRSQKENRQVIVCDSQREHDLRGAFLRKRQRDVLVKGGSVDFVVPEDMPKDFVVCKFQVVFESVANGTSFNHDRSVRVKTLVAHTCESPSTARERKRKAPTKQTMNGLLKRSSEVTSCITTDNVRQAIKSSSGSIPTTPQPKP
jgi:hypothetical protein